MELGAGSSPQVTTSDKRTSRSRSISRGIYSEGCHQGSKTSALLCFPHLLSPQTGWIQTPYSRFEVPELFPQHSSFQDVKSRYSKKDFTRRGIHDQNRYKGCLPSHTYCTPPSKIPSFYTQQEDICVPGSSFRLSAGPIHIHQSPETSPANSEEKRCTDISILRRLNNLASKQEVMSGTHKSNPSDSKRTRFSNKHQKIVHDPITTGHMVGSEMVWGYPLYGFNPGVYWGLGGYGYKSDGTKKNNQEGVGKAHGESCIRRPDSSSSTLKQPRSSSIPKTDDRSSMLFGNKEDCQITDVLDSSAEFERIPQVQNPTTVNNFVDRCFKKRLRSSNLGGSDYPGDLDKTRTPLAYQHQGTDGCALGSEIQDNQTQNLPGVSHRQHYNDVCHQEFGLQLVPEAPASIQVSCP